MTTNPLLQSVWIYREWVLLGLLIVVSCFSALQFVEIKSQVEQKNAALDQVKQLVTINGEQNIRLVKLEKTVAKQSQTLVVLAESIQVSDRKVELLQNHLDLQSKVVANLTRKVDESSTKLVAAQAKVQKVREKCEYFENTYGYLINYKAEKLECDKIE